MAWLVVGRLRGETKSPVNKKSGYVLRDTIKPLYFPTSNTKDYCIRTQRYTHVYLFQIDEECHVALQFVRNQLLKGKVIK